MTVFKSTWSKYWSFTFSISPYIGYLGLIFFRIDRLDLLAVQETLKSLLQHHSSKASISWSSAFFKVQLSHPYMTTGKTIALTILTFVSKVMSLFFNTLSRFVIAFHPRNKSLLLSLFQSLSSDFGAQCVTAGASPAAQLEKNPPANAGDIRDMGVTAVDKHSLSELKSRGEKSLRLGFTEAKPGVEERRGMQKRKGKKIDVVIL